MAREPSMRRSPEFDLIAAIRERLGPRARDSERLVLGVGDDAAITVPGGATATSIDAIVDGVHFRRRWCPPEAVGHKAIAAALSDLAAMGAEPGEAYVWLGRPDDLVEEELLRLCDGLAAAAERAPVAVAGGDLTGSPVLAVCATVVGHADAPGDLVGRDGAEPGGAVCVTGRIGGSAAGLMLAEHETIAAAVPRRLGESLLERQLRPRARIAEGRALAAAGAVAMIDVSDGLGADAEHLAAASGVGLEIEVERVPIAEGVARVAEEAGRDPYELALGGEDYELLCVLPRARVAAAAEAVAGVGSALTEIGSVVSGSSVRLRLTGGRSMPVRGFDQFRH